MDIVQDYCDEDSSVVGVIIINFKSSNVLPKEVFNKGIPQKPAIYVVTQEDGEQIIDFFNTQVDEEGIKLKVYAENDVDSALTSMCLS